MSFAEKLKLLPGIYERAGSLPDLRAALLLILADVEDEMRKWPEWLKKTAADVDSVTKEKNHD